MDYIFNTHPNDMLSPEGIAVLRMIDRTIKDEDNPINASTSAVFFLRGVVPTIFEVEKMAATIEPRKHRIPPG